ARVRLDCAQLADAGHVDQHRRRHDAAPDVDHEIGAAAEKPRIGMRGARLQRFLDALRAQQVKVRQRVHQLCPLPPLCRSLARRRFSIAANTRSGVTGRSLKRTPIASAIALVSAGRKAASEPSPASLAPNGPCGSLLSTMPTSMGGESWMVGTR